MPQGCFFIIFCPLNLYHHQNQTYHHHHHRHHHPVVTDSKGQQLLLLRSMSPPPHRALWEILFFHFRFSRNERRFNHDTRWRHWRSQRVAVYFLPRSLLPDMHVHARERLRAPTRIHMDRGRMPRIGWACSLECTPWSSNGIGARGALGSGQTWPSHGLVSQAWLAFLICSILISSNRPLHRWSCAD